MLGISRARSLAALKLLLLELLCGLPLFHVLAQVHMRGQVWNLILKQLPIIGAWPALLLARPRR